MKRIREFFVTLRQEAAIEAAKLTFALLGVGATLANFSQMHLWIMLPAFSLLSATWYIIYRMYQ
jgi:hypothetical protein